MPSCNISKQADLKAHGRFSLAGSHFDSPGLCHSRATRPNDSHIVTHRNPQECIAPVLHTASGDWLRGMEPDAVKPLLRVFFCANAYGWLEQRGSEIVDLIPDADALKAVGLG
jgi:hypothetical protein